MVESSCTSLNLAMKRATSVAFRHSSVMVSSCAQSSKLLPKLSVPRIDERLISINGRYGFASWDACSVQVCDICTVRNATSYFGTEALKGEYCTNSNLSGMAFAISTTCSTRNSTTRSAPGNIAAWSTSHITSACPVS
jgi:hypothetical protein